MAEPVLRSAYVVGQYVGLGHHKEVMLSLRSFLFHSFHLTIVLVAAGPTVANELADYESLRLVSAMREDERLLRSALVEKLRRTGLSAQDMECLDRFDYPEITDIVASEINVKLTAAEVRDAIGYFQSASGRKLVKRELGTAGEVLFTKADQAELDKFKQRPAGRKLFRDLILKNAAAMAEVMARLDRHLQACAYRRQSDAERGIPTESCQARPVPSLDNVCLATYTAEGTSTKPERASVEVNCRNDGRLLTSRIRLPKPEARVALRWSDDRELEILLDGKIKSAAAPAGSSVKISFASRGKNDPPPLECVPLARGRPTLAETLPPNVTVGAWRAYSRPGLCLMTARVLKKEVAEADGDMLLQFRRQTPAVPPFATTELALVVEIYQQTEQPLQLDFGQKRLTLIAQPPHQTHMLAGQAAEVALQGLRSKPIELTVRRAGVPSYPIPVRRVDFDFAYAGFSECLAGLGTT
jgi:hypothetical protein